jgi:hypothetical protein
MWRSNRDVDLGVVKSGFPIVIDFFENNYYFQLHWKSIIHMCTWFLVIRIFLLQPGSIIDIYFLIIKANKMHYFSNVFDKVLYMFRTCPLFVIRSISTLYTRNSYSSFKFCWRLLADVNRISMTNTYCLYAVLRYFWWWRVDIFETCRVLYQINLRNMHLVGFQYKNIHDAQSSKCQIWHIFLSRLLILRVESVTFSSTLIV